VRSLYRDKDRQASSEAKIARLRPSKMSEQFFYVHLKFIPKIVTLTVTILRQREVVVEVSKRLIHGPPTEQ
jgi:hypothetical protein